MVFSLNDFLMSVSFVLDFVEMDFAGRRTNHGKRVAYLSLRIAEQLNFIPEKIYDVLSLAILHDNGMCEQRLRERLKAEDDIPFSLIERTMEHCVIGETNIKTYPFLTDPINVIKYHHEHYDGSGFFGLVKDEIPISSQIIFLADSVENNFDLQNFKGDNKNEILEYVQAARGSLFSPEVVDAFIEVSNAPGFKLDLRDDYISLAIKNRCPLYEKDLSFDEIERITRLFSSIIDSKSKFTRRHSSGLAQKIEIMSNHYHYDDETRMKLKIAANLHDLGKLAVSNKILDSHNKLTNEEFHKIEEHTYYTRIALQPIKGFEDITEWAANHHEKLNGKGYPFGLTAEELDFNSRLMGCLDIYQALTEERPYRVPMSHKEAMNVLNNSAEQGFIDVGIVRDIDFVFG